MAAVLMNTTKCAAPASAGDEAVARWRRWLHASAPAGPVATAGRVLLISYQFPPTGGSGVQRPAKLAKYLARIGWHVEALAAAHERFPWCDPSLLEGLGPGVRMHRVLGWEPACVARRMSDGLRTCAGRMMRGVSAERARWVEDRLYWRFTAVTSKLGCGQGESLWIPSAVAAAMRLHRARPFDAFITTGPPHFVHRVGLRVQRLTGLPWIADLRDPLVSDFDRTPTDPERRIAQRRLERAIARHATAITTTCPALVEDLRARYPAADVRAITNGYDRDDLRSALDSAAEAARPNRGECVFVAAGSLYGRREVNGLVTPLRRILEAHPAWRGRVRLVLAGSIDAAQRQRWERDRPEWLTLAGYLDHAAALRLTASAACNMVMVPDCTHGRLSIPGKLFELLAVPAHVLVLAPDGCDTARIAGAAGASTVVPLEDLQRVAQAMRSIIAGWFDGTLCRDRDWGAVDAYDRASVAAQFAEVLNTVRGGRLSVEQGP